MPGIRLLSRNHYLVRITAQNPKTGRRQDRTQIVVGSLADAVLAKQGTRAPCSPTSLRDYATQWLAARRDDRDVGDLAASTLDRYINACAHITLHLGDIFIDQLTAADITGWLRQERKVNSAPTVNGYLRVLRQVLDIAVEAKAVEANLARSVRARPEPKQPEGRRHVSLRSLAELRAFCEAAQQYHAEDLGRMLIAVAMTGMRRGELLALRWADYESDNGVLHVRQALDKISRRPKPPKNGLVRDYPVISPLDDVLGRQRAWLIRQQHRGLSSGLIFPASYRQARAGQSRRGAETLCWYRAGSCLNQPIRDVCHAAGLPEMSLHGLRRTFDGLLRQGGIDALVRRELSGWADQSIQERYTTVRLEEKRAAVKKALKS